MRGCVRQQEGGIDESVRRFRCARARHDGDLGFIVLRTDDRTLPGRGDAPACEVLGSNEATLNNPPVMPPQAKNPPNPVSGADGSDNGFFNKFDLFTDACLE